MTRDRFIRRHAECGPDCVVTGDECPAIAEETASYVVAIVEKGKLGTVADATFAWNNVEHTYEGGSRDVAVIWTANRHDALTQADRLLATSRWVSTVDLIPDRFLKACGVR